MRVSFLNNKLNFTNASSNNFENILPHKKGQKVNNNSINRQNCLIGASSAALLAAGGIIYFASKRKVTLTDADYISSLAKALSENLNKPIPSENLRCVMGRDEFLSIIKSMKPENYSKSGNNMEKGIFCVDLHSHSTHSDGWGHVKDILKDAEDYGRELFKKTGKKFIFALTDHDQASGVKEALTIISQNPEQYNHIRFVPGVELSFCVPSGNEILYGEMLAHCINPFAKNVDNLIQNIHAGRKNMIGNTIKSAGQGFSISEMDDYFLNADGETFAYSLHYRVMNYLQIKNRVNGMAKEQGKNPEELYKTLMDDFLFCPDNEFARKIPKPFVSPEKFDEYIRAKGIKTSTHIIDEALTKKCSEYFPQIKDDKIVSDSENSFEKIIETFGGENVTLSFAHPYFFSSQTANAKSIMTNMIKNSKGLIQASESFHQAYPAEVSTAEINEINQFLEAQNLIPIGGHDNHKAKFIKN